jgi:putative transposase
MDMIDPNHKRLSIVRQCSLMSVSRSSFYYQGKGESPFNLKLMRLIDEQWLKTPFFGSRRMAKYLRGEGYNVSRKRVRRLMRKMGIQAIYPKPRTSRPKKENPVYPYLLRGLSIDRPNQVWCSDITYIPMHQGFMYLAAVMDWHSRKVLSWRLSNTLEADFCVAALEDAIAEYGIPGIFNTDQGSQFTSSAFTDVLEDNHIKISMDAYSGPIRPPIPLEGGHPIRGIPATRSGVIRPHCSICESGAGLTRAVNLPSIDY